MPAVAGRHPDLDRGGDREAIRVRVAGWGWGAGREEDRRERDKGLPTSFLFGNLLTFPLFTY